MDKLLRLLFGFMGRKEFGIARMLHNCMGQPDLPLGYTSKEIVRKAIEFDSPPRIPYMLNTHPCDIHLVVNAKGYVPVKKPKNLREIYVDGWGVKKEYTGTAWDHAIDHPFKDIDNINNCKFPNFDFSTPDFITKKLIKVGKKRNKYILGMNSINMMELMRELLSFEEHMMSPYTKPEFLKDLIDKLTDMTCELIEGYQINGGIDGFYTVEDWGLQSGLQMDIKHFREFYKPAYKRVIDFCHERGIHFFWHCCGDIIDLLPEMVDLNVDAVQMDQPRLMGYENIIEASKGKLCFFNNVDIQWAAKESTTHDEIVAETKKMIDIHKEKMPKGGFIMRHYPQPEDIDLSREKQFIVAKTFLSVN